MAELAPTWDVLPDGLVVERCEERPDALLFSFPLRERSRPLAELTPAERVVLDGVCRGLSNAQIAYQRKASVRTVANQIASLFKKLGATSRLDLALLAARSAPVESGCPDLRTGERLARRTPVR